MSTNRAAQIANIIQKRKPLVQKIEVVQNNLQEISAALQSLENARDEIIKIADPQIQGRLKDIDFSLVQRRISDELSTFTKLKRRFLRDTLNIGVIGRARQGKSRLLQTLSGLTSIQIPDGKGGHCTGVRSTIYHNPDDPPYADVWFYSERAFLDEVIAPYYHDLVLGSLPKTISDFKNNALPALPPNKQLAVDREKYGHLQKYQDKFSEYGDLLHASSPRRIQHDQIREYVAQDTPDGKGEFFNFLAVREVRIVCSFPLTHVGQIALIDMPGLGDTGVGDQERLVKTLEEDVDIVLFVKRPGALGANWEDVDIQLYDVAQKALNKIPLERWSFMVLNRVGRVGALDSNVHNCVSLRDKLNTTAIKVAQCIITDCSQSAEVNHSILGKALDYMSKNITALDEEYARASQESLDILHNEVNAILAKARDVWSVSVSSDDLSGDAFDDEFELLWDVIQISLENLKRQLQVKRDESDKKKEQHGAQHAFRVYLNQALTKCQSIKLPSLQEISNTRDANGGSYSTAYDIHLNRIRTEMISHLSSLDRGLKISIISTKNEVAKVLINEGLLGKLTTAMGVTFLKFVYEQIPDEFVKLKEAFGNFYFFEIRFRGFLLYRIREKIKPLEPDEAVKATVSSPKHIYELLENARDETVWKLKSIRKWVGDLDRVAFALVEEFVDQAIRAKKVRKEWKRFYRGRKREIWPNEFGALEKQADLRNKWQKDLERVSQANHSNSLRLIN